MGVISGPFRRDKHSCDDKKATDSDSGSGRARLEAAKSGAAVKFNLSNYIDINVPLGKTHGLQPVRRRRDHHPVDLLERKQHLQHAAERRPAMEGHEGLCAPPEAGADQ